jgi:hypothetical protein
MQIHDTLAILLNSFGRPLAGFELKLGVESPFIDIDTVLPGVLFDSCGWQFFKARSIATYGKTGVPPVLWQVVALAETVPGGTRPVCYGWEDEVSVAKLVVTSEHLTRVPDTVVHISFFWEDCSDNTIAGMSGDILSLSAEVYDYHDVQYDRTVDTFPNRTGAPDDSIDLSRPNHPRRRITFYNGGVEFRLSIEKDTADSGQATD